VTMNGRAGGGGNAPPSHAKDNGGGEMRKNEVIKKMIKHGTEKVNHGKVRWPSYAVVIPSYWLQRVGFDQEERLVSLELKEDCIILRIHKSVSS
jgi:hypothetical protein